MLNVQSLQAAVEQYAGRFIPAMQYWGYHLVLAKGGKDYSHLPEQSLFTHVINGVFGLARVLTVVLDEKIPLPHLDETMLRKALTLYTIHDSHKLPGFQKLGTSEFAIPLERLREEYDRLGLKAFADVDEHLMRAVNVSKRSPRQGDTLLAGEEGSFLWLLARIADSIASMVSLHEAETLAGYLKQLAPELGTRYRLYHHEIRDVRGVLTNLIHTVTAQRLEQVGFRPLLFFATGTLYLGPKEVRSFERTKFLDEVATDVLRTMAQYGADRQGDLIQEARRRQKFDFEQYVYLFADVPAILEAVQSNALVIRPKPNEMQEELEDIGKRAPDGWFDSVPKRFGISFDEPKSFNEYWSRVYYYLLHLDATLRDFKETRVEWLAKTFSVPSKVVAALQKDAPLFARGGLGKYAIVVAYHFLRGHDFKDRAAESLPPEEVLECLHRRTVRAFGEIDTRAKREAIVAQLGYRSDLRDYLDEILQTSFSSEILLHQDALTEYSRPKKKSHADKICSICNRRSEQAEKIRTGILGDEAQIFSNRILPQPVLNENRRWCPVCQIEFVLRRLVGIAGEKGSQTLYIYVLPTFSFTPEHIQLFAPLLNQFRHVSALPIRDYGANSLGAPRMWVERRALDPEWMQQIEDILARQVRFIERWPEEHKGRPYSGQRLLTPRTAPQPNYYLILWDESGDELTRTEAWAKATFTTSVIAALTSARVFVTEHPFLSAASAAELKPTVTLDAAPPVIRTVLKSKNSPAGEISLYGRERGGKSDSERALDLTAALWVVTADVHAPNRQSKDKQIAERLALAATEPLAGAHFYKEYGRLNDGQSPYPPLARACEILLEHLGGEMMDLCQRIAEKSLEIRLPFRTSGRGKAHNYELVLREAVDALRAAFNVVPELRQTALTGQKPSDESVKEIKCLAAGTLHKAMERRQTAQRGDGFINPWRMDLVQLVGEFTDLLVDEVFLKRADGSLATFLRLENSLADGVYYYTDRVIGEKWERYNQLKAERQAA